MMKFNNSFREILNHQMFGFNDNVVTIKQGLAMKANGKMSVHLAVMYFHADCKGMACHILF